MSDANDQREQPMEEILASIRRIIAEESVSPASAARDNILELTEMLTADGSVVRIGAEARAAEPAEPADAPEPPAAIAPEPDRHPAETERLVSAPIAAASVAALAQLFEEHPHQPVGDFSLGVPGRTVEDLVREMLRPMLVDWLDGNLPQLVERLVREEIQRLARDAARRA